MNLSKVIAGRSKPLRQYGNSLAGLQEFIKDKLRTAHQEGRRLLIPADELPRAIGKSFICNELAEELGLYVAQEYSVIRSDESHRRKKIRSMRGIRASSVLIDEVHPTSIERSGIDFIPLIGFASTRAHMIQSFRSELDIAEIKEFIKETEGVIQYVYDPIYQARLN